MFNTPLNVKFITEAKDFCVFFDGSYKQRLESKQKAFNDNRWVREAANAHSQKRAN